MNYTSAPPQNVWFCCLHSLLSIRNKLPYASLYKPIHVKTSIYVFLQKFVKNSKPIHKPSRKKIPFRNTPVF